MSMSRTSSDSQNYGALKSQFWSLRMSKSMPLWTQFTIDVTTAYSNWNPKDKKAAAAIAKAIDAATQSYVAAALEVDKEYFQNMTQALILEQARLKNIDLQAVKDAMIAATKKKATKSKKVRK